MPQEPFINMERVYIYKAADKPIGEVILHIYCAGMTLKNPDYKMLGSMPDTLFEYIVDGEGYINYGGQSYYVKKGDFVIAKSGRDKEKGFSYGSSKNNPYLKIWFTADGKFINSLFDTFDIKEQITVKSTSNSKILNGFQEFIMSLSGNYDELDAMTKILTIMYTVFSEKDKNPPLLNTFNELIKNYIELHIQSPVSLETAAAELGMTTKSFGAYFKDNFNLTYKQYVRKARLNYAKKMLEMTDTTISELALQLGFCSQSYFSNSFYKEFGIYPSVLRENK